MENYFNQEWRIILIKNDFIQSHIAADVILKHVFPLYESFQTFKSQVIFIAHCEMWRAGASYNSSMCLCI